MSFRTALCFTSFTLLIGCVTSPTFSGNSLSDPVLRNDLMNNVSRLFTTQESCSSIESVQTQVAHVDKSDSGKIIGADELWTVNGCGKSITYAILLKTDAKGETDFTIGRPKLQP